MSHPTVACPKVGLNVGVAYFIVVKMNKEEYIKRYSETAYEKMRQTGHDWAAHHRKERNASVGAWRNRNPAKVKVEQHEGGRKGGKYYGYRLRYKTTGIPGERNRIRTKHGIHYRPFKKIISPESQIHHEWIPGTAKYRGIALVEKDQHIHGIIKVIKILEGKITLLSEVKK